MHKGHNGPPPGNPLADLQAVLGTLRRARIAQDKTQQNIASASGMTRQAVGAIESGDRWPSLNNACFLARALGYRVTLVPLEDDA